MPQTQCPITFKNVIVVRYKLLKQMMAMVILFYHLFNSKSLDLLDVNVINIVVDVEISDISFILHNKFHCINGRFITNMIQLLIKLTCNCILSQNLR